MLIEIIILLSGIPAGYLIAWLAKDELKAGRKWFVILMIFSIIALFWFLFAGWKVESFSSGFIFIVSLISLLKSSYGKFIKSKI